MAVSRHALRRFLKVAPLAAAAALAAVLRAGFVGGPADSPQAVVRRVIDGDTVKLADGRHLRYIGIDTPEVRRKTGRGWVKDPEPFGLEAAERNRQWVEGKPVRLEFDVQMRDRYGRLLAYVYVGETMVNAKLLEEGFAQPLTIPPNVRHAAYFRELAAEARRNKRGLWGGSKPQAAPEAG